MKSKNKTKQKRIFFKQQILYLFGVFVCLLPFKKGYLEWEAFAGNVDNNRNKNIEFSRADILIAADVIYDIEVIDSLVGIVKSFLSESLSRTKQAIFAITKRNIASFELFLHKVRTYGIDCDWLVTNCDTLPKVFECTFTQERSDVQVARLTVQDV